MHDGPSPPNIVNFRPVVMMLTYLILSAWAALDPVHLSYACCVVLRPVQIIASCWLASCFIDPQRTLCTTIRVGQWAFNQPLYYVPFYGVTAFVLSLRGHSYAVEVFSFACLVAEAAWTTMSAPTKFKFSMVAVIPAIFAFSLITLPFALVWFFRLTLRCLTSGPNSEFYSYGAASNKRLPFTKDRKPMNIFHSDLEKSDC
jgi:hypothetical protein